MPSPSASQADPHAAAGALGGVGRRTTPPCRDSSLGGSDSDYVLVSAPGDGSTSPCCERESAGGVGSVGGVPQPPALAFAPYAAPSAAEFAVSAEDSPDPAAEEEAAYLQGLLDLANLLARGGAIADLATLSAEGMAHGEPLTAVEALALHVKALDLMSHGISVAERVAATRNQTPDALLPAAAEAISQAEALRARGAGLLRSAEGVRAALAAQQREAHTATGRTAGDSGAFVAGGGSPGGGSGAFVMGGGPGGAGSGLGGPGGAGSGLGGPGGAGSGLGGPGGAGSGLGGPGGAGSGLFVMGGCAGGGGDFTMGEAGAGGAGGAGSDVDPMSVCVEEVLYRQALSMGRRRPLTSFWGSTRPRPPCTSAPSSHLSSSRLSRWWVMPTGRCCKSTARASRGGWRRCATSSKRLRVCCSMEVPRAARTLASLARLHYCPNRQRSKNRSSSSRHEQWQRHAVRMACYATVQTNPPCTAHSASITADALRGWPAC